MFNLGDFTTADTIYVPLTTYDSAGASVTLTGLAITDIKIYKDGSVTQRASDAGYALLDTDGIDFDLITGLHGFSIDLSDNTDAGFYANGSQYWLVVNSVTIDSQVVNVAYYFTIGRYLKPTTAGRTLDVSATGEAGLDFANIKDATGTHTLTNITVPTVTTVGSVTGAVNSVIGSVGSISGVTFPTNFGDMSISVTTGLVDITQTAADKVWGTAARILTANTNFNDPTAATIADAVWDELQSGHVGVGTFGEIATESASILVDTNELQTNQGNWVTAIGFATSAKQDTMETTLNDVPTTAEFNARTLPSADYVVVTDTIAGVTLCTTCTNNTDMRGTNSAALAATALSSAVWTNTKAGYIDAAISGITTTISDADIDKIWDELQSGHTIAGSFGKYLDVAISEIEGTIGSATYILDTIVSVADSNSSFTLAAGAEVAGAYTFLHVSVKDAIDNHIEVRAITNWSATRKITLDRPLTFVPAAGDEVHILEEGYALRIDRSL